MIALYILAGIVGVLVILLLIPLKIHFRFDEEAALKLHYLFWHFTLWPQEKEKEQAVKPKRKKKPDKPPVQKEPDIWEKIKSLLKKKGARFFLQLTGQVIGLLGSSLKRVLCHLHIKEMDVYFVAAADNAADAAMLYGEACAALYPAVNVLSRWGRCKSPAVMVDIDYQRQQAGVSALAKGWILPLFLLVEGLRFLVKGIPYINELR